MTIKNILDEAVGIYHYGSFVYGTFQEDSSDYDYIVIVQDKINNLDSQLYEDEKNQYHFYTISTWQKMLLENHVVAVETYFLPEKFKIRETMNFDFELNIHKIRENFSKTASNSFVKCKKKLTVPESFNPYIAKKSLWHSLRILNFGIQLLKTGKIQDYSNANDLYYEIVCNNSSDWEYYHKKYKNLYNSLKSEFRKLE